MTALPSFRIVHDAILNAPPPAPGFPLGALVDADSRLALLHNQLVATLLRQISDEAKRATSTPIPPLPFAHFQLFEKTGDRATFERAYFDRRRRLAALVLQQALYHAEKDETSRDGATGAEEHETLENLLWEICNEYSWALPAHLPVGVETVRAGRLPPEEIIDLFAAETAVALAETLAVLGAPGGAGISPYLDYRIRHEIERRIFQPLFHNPFHFDWESDPANWAAVCAGSAGIAALVLVQDRERLAGMIDRVLRSLEVFLSGFPADGGSAEGIVYWEYGFGFYLYFAEAFRDFSAGALDLLAGDHIKRIAAFPNLVALGADRFVNFSDANTRTRLHSGIGSRLAQRLDVTLPPLSPPDFYTDHIFRWMHIARDLVWINADVKHATLADGSFFLPDLAWVIDRRTVNGKTFAFAAKGGNNDEPHNHNDLGHFILNIGGESLLADGGAGRYTRQYFGAERYASIHTGAHGHSVPVVNGKFQQQGETYRVQVLSHKALPDGVHLALDLTAAYGEEKLRSLVRSFTWQVGENDALLILADAFESASPLRLDECFISLFLPTLDLDGEPCFVTWHGEHCEVRLQFSAQDWLPEIESTETQDHFGNAFIIHRLLLRSLTARNSMDAAFHFRSALLQ